MSGFKQSGGDECFKQSGIRYYICAHCFGYGYAAF